MNVMRTTKPSFNRRALATQAVQAAAATRAKAKLDNIEKAWRLLRWWPRIREQVSIVAASAAFELPLAYGAGRLKVMRV